MGISIWEHFPENYLFTFRLYMLKIKPIAPPIFQKILLGLTLILSVFSFSGSSFSSSNFHQNPPQSELLYSTLRKRKSAIFFFSGFIRTNSHFLPNQSILEKVMQLLYSGLCNIQFHVLNSQHFFKDINLKLIPLKTQSLDSEVPNLNFSLG